MIVWQSGCCCFEACVCQPIDSCNIWFSLWVKPDRGYGDGRGGSEDEQEWGHVCVVRIAQGGAELLACSRYVPGAMRVQGMAWRDPSAWVLNMYGVVNNGSQNPSPVICFMESSYPICLEWLLTITLEECGRRLTTSLLCLRVPLRLQHVFSRRTDVFVLLEGREKPKRDSKLCPPCTTGCEFVDSVASISE